MELTSRQIQLVESSFQILLVQVDIAARIFYERLCELDPALKSSFTQTDRLLQGRQFIRMMLAVVMAADNSALFEARIHELSQHHARYGLKPEHYQAVGEALIWTVRCRLNNHFTPELNQAWTTFFEAVRANLIQDKAYARH